MNKVEPSQCVECVVSQLAYVECSSAIGCFESQVHRLPKSVCYLIPTGAPATDEADPDAEDPDEEDPDEEDPDEATEEEEEEVEAKWDSSVKSSKTASVSTKRASSVEDEDDEEDQATSLMREAPYTGKKGSSEDKKGPYFNTPSIPSTSMTYDAS